MYEKLLPIGSVVLLKGGNKRIMVTGRIQAKVGDKTVYDYSACYYPEGMIDPSETLFFNHSDIARLYFIGFQDPEELAFRAERLKPIGELYINDEGEIVERAAEADEADDEDED